MHREVRHVTVYFDEVIIASVIFSDKEKMLFLTVVTRFKTQRHIFQIEMLKLKIHTTGIRTLYS